MVEREITPVPVGLLREHPLVTVTGPRVPRRPRTTG